MRLAALREQLSRYRPADTREAGFVARMAELSHEAASCQRSHFIPGHFTASAFVLDPSLQEVILIHHRKLGIWVQPGGHIDDSDLDIESAARREVAEEVGLAELEHFAALGSGLFDVDIHAIPAHKQELAHEHFDVRFAFVAGTRALLGSEEVVALRWVPLGEMPSVATDASVLRAVAKLRAVLA